VRVLPVLPGDGIGPEVTRSAMTWLRAQGFQAPFLELPFGHGCWLETGEALPRPTIEAIEQAGVALLGAATTPDEGCSSPILQLRRELDLDLTLRPMPGGGPSLLIHNFAGLYAEPEQSLGNEARSSWSLTLEQARRLLDEAFRRSDRVTVVDKPTVRRHAARLFREAAYGRPMELLNADAFVVKLLQDPYQYELIACTSFLGDVLSDLLAALGTGLPSAASVSFSPTVSVFEPVHGTAPHRVGRADPSGAIAAAGMLLEHVNAR
jgi:isocitrate dehydrogenase (NAD+)